MTSSELSSSQLIALSSSGDREQLATALQQPATAQVALSTEIIFIDSGAGVQSLQLNLRRMIEAAAAAGHAETVETLLGFGQQHKVAAREMITADTIGAALRENPLEILLKFKAVDSDVFSHPLHIGGTVLEAACYGGPSEEDCPRSKYLGLVKYLMHAGFDPNGKPRSRHPNRRKPCPLYWACWQACCEIVESLLAHGATVTGSMALHSASRNARLDVLELLLRHGGDVNEVTEEDDIDGPPGTPLHCAAAAGNEDVVRWLLAHGANANVKNCKGKSAKDVVGEDGDGTIRRLLEEAEGL